MPEYSANYTLSIDVEIYFEAADERTADDLAEVVGEVANLALNDPTVREIVAIDPNLKGVVLDVSYDGPYGHSLNSGPYEVD